MKKIFHIILVSLAALSCTMQQEYDIVIVGGSASGTAAAIEASRTGGGALNILLVEETPLLGGMLTAAGVSATDGCHNLCGGIWKEFRDSLVCEYGSLQALHTGWVSNTLFEPSVGNRIFQNMIQKSPGVDSLPNTEANNFKKTPNGWILQLSNGRKVNTKILVDATELGDVAAEAGVEYEVSEVPQDLTYVVTLKDYGKPSLIAKPNNYDRENYIACCRSEICPDAETSWSKEYMMQYGALPRGKYMINWPLHGNDYYVDLIGMNREQRDSAIVIAKNYALGFIYFLQSELGFENLGISDDYPSSDGLPLIPYYREARHIKGLVRLEIEDIQRPYENEAQPFYKTAIAVGDYPVDQHHKAYKGPVTLPDLSCYPVPAYGIPLGALVPKGIDNMLVAEKSISVSNIVTGSTRLQPVVLQLGQAAGALAALSVMNNIRPAEVSVRAVQEVLLNHGAYLLPTTDVAPSHPHFAAIQRVLASGEMRYEGKTEGWSNSAFFYPDAPYNENNFEEMSQNLTRAQAAEWIDTHIDSFHKYDIDLNGNKK